MFNSRVYFVFGPFALAQAAGKRKSRVPVLPSGFVYDLPSLTRPPNSAVSNTAPDRPSPSSAVATTPRVENPVLNPSPGNSSDLQLLNLQIEKQQLELRLLELEAQSRARELVFSSSSTKPQSISSLNTVRTGVNNGKLQGQLDHNTRIVNPQEWPHLHGPFGLSRNNFKDLSMAEFVYWYLDILTAQTSPHQSLMISHLMTLMRLASKYDWEAVLSFHAAVLNRIESGLANWGDDFSEIERFNITESNRLQAKPASVPAMNKAGGENNNVTRSRNYCREWNRTGTCSNTSHQQGAEHICAYCKLPDHTIGSCPTRPPPSNPS